MTAFTALTTGSDSVTRSSYDTASIAPAANRLLLISVSSTRSDGAEVTSITGLGLTWTRHDGSTVGSSPTRAASVWKAETGGSAPTPGVVTLNYSSGPTSVKWAVVAVEDYNTAAPITQAKVATGLSVTSITATFDTAPAAGSGIFAATAINVQENIAPGSGLTELTEVTIGGPNGTLETAARTTGAASASSSWTTATNAIMVALEIAAPAGGGSVTGSGAATAQAGAASGAGTATTTGSGTPTAPAATASGAGTATAAGAGAASGAEGQPGGTGAATATGTGAATAPAGVAHGTSGEPEPAVGSGAAAGEAGVASGAGAATTSGEGTATAPDGTATGAGAATTSGSGTGTAQAGQASGAGTVSEPEPVRDVTFLGFDEHQRVVTFDEQQRTVTYDEHQREITWTGDDMHLKPTAVEYYDPRPSTEPAVAAASWEASFDGGATWTAATVVDTLPKWLVGGPDAAAGSHQALTGNTTPQLRVVDNPETVVRDAPPIYVY